MQNEEFSKMVFFRGEMSITDKLETGDSPYFFASCRQERDTGFPREFSVFYAPSVSETAILSFLTTLKCYPTRTNSVSVRPSIGIIPQKTYHHHYY